MQIRNILAGHPDPAGQAARGEAAEAAGSGSPQSADSHVLSPTAATAATAEIMAEILARYDVTDISPDEFSRMIQKLFEAGTISEEERQQLAAIRLDMDLDGVKADESVDLLDLYARKIKKVQSALSDSDDPAADRQRLAPLLHSLEWLDKFALIQSTPDALGLDAVV